MRRSELAAVIDSTLLKPDATPEDVGRLCREAIKYGFRAVCVNPAYVKLADSLLSKSKVRTCTVVGFPLGATLPEVKIYEAKTVIALGADDVDVVINVGALKAGNYEVVAEELRKIVEIAHENNVVVKAILELGLLDEGEKVVACRLARDAGVDYVKTSTGFGPAGATVQDVRLLRRCVGRRVGVKAAGGIRTLRDALAMLRAGADLIGTSTAAKIVEEAPP